MIDSLQIWVSTPYFVLLTLNDSWMGLGKEFAINISYNDVVTGLQVNYRLVIYANIDENHSAKSLFSKEICTRILIIIV